MLPHGNRLKSLTDNEYVLFAMLCKISNEVTQLNKKFDELMERVEFAPESEQYNKSNENFKRNLEKISK